MNHRMVLAGLAGLVLCVGCAREHPVTLDGSTPGPIVEEPVVHKASEPEPVAARMPSSEAVEVSPVTLVKQNDGIHAVNSSDTMQRVKLRAAPALQNAATAQESKMYVLVPAKSEVKVGSGEDWTYTIIDVDEKK